MAHLQLYVVQATKTSVYSCLTEHIIITAAWCGFALLQQCEIFQPVTAAVIFYEWSSLSRLIL